ncbi:hypothetical protein [Saccharolobus islandicus]|uniref:Uncharacterized protein n=1 Tax=Saccharolobus islandicus LAL14/1 TaxID=1241935 RepID=M9UCN4_SACIS|nr:hypothetical protein [Sulfolobus islandicus]AGJ63853.1 Hypothetical Protein SiL_2417 [Sulfolobus islandicus LAL14/1]
MYCLDDRKRIPANVVCSSYNFRIRAIVNGKPYMASYEELWNFPLDGLNSIHLFENLDYALRNDPFLSATSSIAIFVSEKEDIEGFVELILSKTFFEIRSIILAENPISKYGDNETTLSSSSYYYSVSYRNDRLMIKAKDREGYYEINMKLHNFTFVSDYRELLRNVEKVGKSTRVVI